MLMHVCITSHQAFSYSSKCTALTICNYNWVWCLVILDHSVHVYWHKLCSTSIVELKKMVPWWSQWSFLIPKQAQPPAPYSVQNTSASYPQQPINESSYPAPCTSGSLVSEEPPLYSGYTYPPAPYLHSKQDSQWTEVILKLTVVASNLIDFYKKYMYLS